MRTVVRTERFELSGMLVEPCVATFDVMMEGLEGVLSRDPAEGTHIDPPFGLIWKIDHRSPPREFASVTVYYSFDSESVYLLEVKARTPID